MKLTSTAFEEGGMMPSRHTCDNLNVSPPLKWSPGPEGTKFYAIICDDPDAPAWTWVHWIIFNIPAEKTRLEENIPKESVLPDGSRQGKNDFGRIGYGGPCPPVGMHRYFFKIYCLSDAVNLDTAVTKTDLLKAMKGLILEEGQLMGRYQRK